MIIVFVSAAILLSAVEEVLYEHVLHAANAKWISPPLSLFVCVSIHLGWCFGSAVSHQSSCFSFFIAVCWTKWYDRDNPSGTGDWELISNLKTENPGEICNSPLYIEAVTTDTLTPAISTGEVLYV